MIPLAKFHQSNIIRLPVFIIFIHKFHVAETLFWISNSDVFLTSADSPDLFHLKPRTYNFGNSVVNTTHSWNEIVPRVVARDSHTDWFSWVGSACLLWVLCFETPWLWVVGGFDSDGKFCGRARGPQFPFISTSHLWICEVKFPLERVHRRVLDVPNPCSNVGDSIWDLLEMRRD